jgi:hypothetical protein
MERMAKSFAALCVLLGALGASAAPIDWRALAGEQTVAVRTTEADGAPRETTAWLVVVDGQGYLRTGETHWHGNIARDPKIAVRIAGHDYAVTAEHVTDPALRAKIEAAFYEKYGFADTFVGWFTDRTKAQILALVPRAPDLSAP